MAWGAQRRLKRRLSQKSRPPRFADCAGGKRTRRCLGVRAEPRAISPATRDLLAPLDPAGDRNNPESRPDGSEYEWSGTCIAPLAKQGGQYASIRKSTSDDLGGLRRNCAGFVDLPV